MSVVPNEVVNEVWTQWQGYVIDGVFPLGRFLGCSDYGGVFLTRSATPGLPDVAIKLVPTTQDLAQSQLAQWRETGGLAHPHLLGLSRWGACELAGLPYLYVVMEYADQTLAQLLRHRALTDEEGRELLQPILDTLRFLHGRNLVQGRLKPSNILVVGDQLKLASDTVRRAGEGLHASTADDIWALGFTLIEAFGARPPSGTRTEKVTLPADFSPAFREVVGRCLSPNPSDRPDVAQLRAWLGGEPATSLPPRVEPTRVEAPESNPPAPAQVPSTALAPPAAGGARAASRPSTSRTLLVSLGAVVFLAAVWSGIRSLRSHASPPPSQNGSLVQAPVAAPVAAAAAEPATAKPSPAPGGSDANALAALHQVIPEVSRGAHRTIHGHIKVWVRVTLGQNGSVLTAVPDRSGSSRYFQRIAIEAAKKWTFAPSDAPARRSAQIRFDFSRDGTTAQAVKLD